MAATPTVETKAPAPLSFTSNGSIATSLLDPLSSLGNEVLSLSSEQSMERSNLMEREEMESASVKATRGGPHLLRSDSERVAIDLVGGGRRTLRKCILGVCAMDKKTKSKPMIQILDRLRGYGEFVVIVFGNDLILNDDISVTEWPVVDCLISFYSTGFPLHKAIEYVKLRKPFCVNDLASQTVLNDRMAVYKILDQHGIPSPRHLYAVRENGAKVNMFNYEDSIEINGERMPKPIVEKPLKADDHNVRVYYGKKNGGGSRRLFRKVGDRSSRFYPHANATRSRGSYVYEQLLKNGKDLKVYTIGPGYAHGETRKSPVVDGIVERNPDNKELRLLTRLTEEEKQIAARICVAFQQNICGFDIIRSRGKSYVIDVNGWSFVKGDMRYYDKCARILRKMCLESKPGRAALALPEPIHGSLSTHGRHSRSGSGDSSASWSGSEDEDERIGSRHSSPRSGSPSRSRTPSPTGGHNDSGIPGVTGQAGVGIGRYHGHGHHSVSHRPHHHRGHTEDGSISSYSAGRESISSGSISSYGLPGADDGDGMRHHQPLSARRRGSLSPSPSPRSSSAASGSSSDEALRASLTNTISTSRISGVLTSSTMSQPPTPLGQANNTSSAYDTFLPPRSESTPPNIRSPNQPHHHKSNSSSSSFNFGTIGSTSSGTGTSSSLPPGGPSPHIVTPSVAIPPPRSVAAGGASQSPRLSNPRVDKSNASVPSTSAASVANASITSGISVAPVVGPAVPMIRSGSGGSGHPASSPRMIPQATLTTVAMLGGTSAILANMVALSTSPVAPWEPFTMPPPKPPRAVVTPVTSPPTPASSGVSLKDKEAASALLLAAAAASGSVTSPPPTSLSVATSSSALNLHAAAAAATLSPSTTLVVTPSSSSAATVAAATAPGYSETVPPSALLHQLGPNTLQVAATSLPLPNSGFPRRSPSSDRLASQLPPRVSLADLFTAPDSSPAPSPAVGNHGPPSRLSTDTPTPSAPTTPASAGPSPSQQLYDNTKTPSASSLSSLLSSVRASGIGLSGLASVPESGPSPFSPAVGRPSALNIASPPQSPAVHAAGTGAAAINSALAAAAAANIAASGVTTTSVNVTPTVAASPSVPSSSPSSGTSSGTTTPPMQPASSSSQLSTGPTASPRTLSVPHSAAAVLHAAHSHAPITSLLHCSLERICLDIEHGMPNQSLVPSFITDCDNNDVLRAVVGVFRHADRTPKQKVKVKMKDEIIRAWFANAKDKQKEIKLKKGPQLEKLLGDVRAVIHSEQKKRAERAKAREAAATAAVVAAFNGNGNGNASDAVSPTGSPATPSSNRVSSLAVSSQPASPASPSTVVTTIATTPAVTPTIVDPVGALKREGSNEQKASSSGASGSDTPIVKDKSEKPDKPKKSDKEIEAEANDFYSKLCQVQTVLEQQYGGIKVQLKPNKVENGEVTTVLLVCKWGGEMTHAGIGQARQYGPVFWDDMMPPPPNHLERQRTINLARAHAHSHSSSSHRHSHHHHSEHRHSHHHHNHRNDHYSGSGGGGGLGHRSDSLGSSPSISRAEPNSPLVSSRDLSMARSMSAPSGVFPETPSAASLHNSGNISTIGGGGVNVTITGTNGLPMVNPLGVHVGSNVITSPSQPQRTDFHHTRDGGHHGYHHVHSSHHNYSHHAHSSGSSHGHHGGASVHHTGTAAISSSVPSHSRESSISRLQPLQPQPLLFVGGQPSRSAPGSPSKHGNSGYLLGDVPSGRGSGNVTNAIHDALYGSSPPPYTYSTGGLPISRASSGGLQIATQSHLFAATTGGGGSFNSNPNSPAVSHRPGSSGSGSRGGIDQQPNSGDGPYSGGGLRVGSLGRSSSSRISWGPELCASIKEEGEHVRHSSSLSYQQQHSSHHGHNPITHPENIIPTASPEPDAAIFYDRNATVSRSDRDSWLEMLHDVRGDHVAQVLSEATKDQLEQAADDQARKRSFFEQRLAFFRGMQVYASDEERVRASAKAFYQSTFSHAYHITDHNKDSDESKAILTAIEERAARDIHSDAEVQTFLDDTSMSSAAMEKAKNDVLSLCTADVQLTHVQFAEQLLLSEQIEKATTDEERDARTEEKNKHMAACRQLAEQAAKEKQEKLERYRQMMEEEERAEREADARGAKETMPEEEEEINEELEKQKKKDKKKDKKKKKDKSKDGDDGDNSEDSGSENDAKNGKSKRELSMTAWGIRCLRWLNTPRDTLFKMYRLMQELQRQIHSKCELMGDEKALEELREQEEEELREMLEMEKKAAGHDEDATDYMFEDGDEEIVGHKYKIKKKATKRFPTDHLLCHNETLLLMKTRWDKLVDTFYDVTTKQFDPTKIPDVYDCIKYDVLHNLDFLTDVRPLYRTVKRVADFVMPQEYGVLRKEKLEISGPIVRPLLNRIIGNLEQGLSDNPPHRVTLYFSSESHIHSLRNVLLLSGVPLNSTTATTLEAIELNYLSHGVFRLYEDLSKPMDSSERFYVNVQFSPGAALDPFIFAEENHVLAVSRPVPVHGRIPLPQFKKMFSAILKPIEGKDNKEANKEGGKTPKADKAEKEGGKDKSEKSKDKGDKSDKSDKDKSSGDKDKSGDKSAATAAAAAVASFTNVIHGAFPPSPVVAAPTPSLSPVAV